MATVRAGARLHVGFQNLSLAHERLYGGVGIAIDEPQVVATAEPAEEIRADDDLVAEYVRRAADYLDVPGASVQVTERLPRHVGLGSGTQLALTVYAAIARAYDRPVDVRSAAPTLGRGGRSGVGVAGFERGGLVVDGGHPTARFTSDRPERGDWRVPPVIAHHDLPAEWRFVLAIPDVERGRSGGQEDASMRDVVERATPEVADEITAVLVRRLLPAAATGDFDTFGAAIESIGRLNGAWYADEQGGVYRPPVGQIVDALSKSDAVAGTGQSSWGPTVYGLTRVDTADEARRAARDALSDAGCGGDVRLVAVDARGARVTEGDERSVTEIAGKNAR